MKESLQMLYGVAYYSQFLIWCRGRLRQIQRRRFRKLLAHAQRKSRYLRDKYRGIDARDATTRDVPSMTKAEMMEHFDDIVTDPRIKRRDLERFVGNAENVGTLFLDQYPVLHTSGSQGQPGIFIQDPGAFMRLFAMQGARGHTLPKTWTTFFTRLFHKHRLAIFQLRPGFYPSGAAFAYMPRAFERFVKILPLQYTGSFDDAIRRLNDFQPNMVSGYGHVMINLARAESEGRLFLKQTGQLQQMVSIAEPVTAAAREKIRQVFDIHLATHYAMGECLTLSLGCPYQSGAHLNIDLADLEVVDEIGREVPNGTRGSKVRVTNLTNFVQPVIRYEIDDVVTMHDQSCPCGNPLPLIREVAGRLNDNLWIDVRGEPRQLPTFFFTTTFHSIFDLAEFQVVQVERNRFEIRAVGLRGRFLSPESILAALREQAVASQLGDVVRFDVTMVDDIAPDARTGKIRRYVSRVGPPDSLRQAS